MFSLGSADLKPLMGSSREGPTLRAEDSPPGSNGCRQFTSSSSTAHTHPKVLGAAPRWKGITGPCGELKLAAVICTSGSHFSPTDLSLSSQLWQRSCLALGDDSSLSLYNALQLLRLPDKYLSLHQSVITYTTGCTNALTWYMEIFSYLSTC